MINKEYAHIWEEEEAIKKWKRIDEYTDEDSLACYKEIERLDSRIVSLVMSWKLTNDSGQKEKYLKRLDKVAKERRIQELRALKMGPIYIHKHIVKEKK